MSLEGIVVLDLGRRYPASLTATCLGDHGAQVIRVDPPGGTPAGRLPTSEERYAAFNPTDRNKRSICLDLKQEAGREVLGHLVKRADVLIEGFRAGVMDRLGIGYPRLKEINPGLIYLALNGFGQDGPYAHTAGKQPMFNAIAGSTSLVGVPTSRPPQALYFCGVSLAANQGMIGVMLALFARSRTGQGQFVDVACLDTITAALAPAAARYFMTEGMAPKRGEAIDTGAWAFNQVFQCKDGKYVAEGAAEPKLWANLCRALGREDFVINRGTPGSDRDAEITAELAAIFKTRTRDEWREFFKDKDAVVAGVNTLDEGLEDPQVVHREMVVEVEHPSVGRVKQTGIPIKMSDTPGKIRRLGEPPGSSTEDVLAELGYGPEEIAGLRESGVIG